MDRFPGSVAWALNPKYKDGTRLRGGPAQDAAFNSVWLPNDCKVRVVECNGGFVYVEKPDGDRGWVKDQNLTTIERHSGVTKGVVSSELVTPDAEYVRGMKIWNCGIKQDPVAGSKFGKGLQHLISSQWLNMMAEFTAAHYSAIRAIVTHAKLISESEPGYDFSYFTNMANHLFNRADAGGLRSRESIDLFLMSTYLIMAAAEVDDFPFSKYSKEQRKAQRDSFYELIMHPNPGPGVSGQHIHDPAHLEGRFACPESRRDLLPPIAMERLGLNNELSGLKYADPTLPMREGFMLSSRIDSLKRHFEGVHRRMYDEDHVIHLLWNFHAIIHVLVVFPDKNDLPDYTTIHSMHVPRVDKKGYEPTTSLEKIQHRADPLGKVLKLDWNEGVIPPPKSVTAALTQFIQAGDGSMLKWYPHLSGGEPLRAEISKYAGAIPENLIVTNGSDDALILICQTFLKTDVRRKTVLTPAPTYEHFCVNAIGAGASLIRQEFPDPFVADADHLQSCIEKEHPDLVYLVSPNNPTGVEWSPEQVATLANRFTETIFLVDEAYIEFGAGPHCASLAAKHRNVIVTRTFSKAFCLAALRCGYIIAHPNTVEELRTLYNPKSVNALAQIAATSALQEFDTYYAPYIKLTNDARNAMLTTLRSHGVDARSGGGGNFICIKAPGGRTKELCAELEKDAIYVRDISGRFPGYVRVTVGLDMGRVIDAIIALVRVGSGDDVHVSNAADDVGGGRCDSDVGSTVNVLM